jgi:hypothetical protein
MMFGEFGTIDTEGAADAGSPTFPEPTDNRPGRGAMLGTFGGLLPLFLAIPLFALGLWSVGLVVYLGGTLLVIGPRLGRRESVGSLDLSSLVFGVLLAIAFFGFGNVFFLQHFGVVINTLLLAQVLSGELRRQPWTAQFAKRMYPPAQWDTRAFFEGNRFLSRLWGLVFVVSILMATFGTTPLVLFVLPTGLLVAALVLGPPLARWYGRRFPPTVEP